MTETILASRRLYAGKIVTLDLLDVRLPDGQEGLREVIQHPGAAAVVPLDDDGNVLLVRQFRSASRTFMLEIPAGVLNPGENPAAAAARELREETGYAPRHIESLGGLHTAPGYTSEFIHLFLARGLDDAPLARDVDEFIELVRLPLAEALALVKNGTITDAKTVIGLLRTAL